MFVGKSTGKALGKEKSGTQHPQGRRNSAEVSLFSHLRNRTLDLLMPPVLCLMTQKACSPCHSVNKHWWERKGDWSYDRLMRLLWHGLLVWGTASCRVSGCTFHICQPVTEARALNGGWSSGTGLAPWSMMKATQALIWSDIQAPETLFILITILGHFRWMLISA